MRDLIYSDDPSHPANLIPELCKLFYDLGWVEFLFAKGNMYILHLQVNLLILSSTFLSYKLKSTIITGVQKERMHPSDLFVLELSTCTVLRAPENVVMVTLLYTRETFEITHQEMIKGIRRGSGKENLHYYDTLVVPIIDNTPNEEDLTEGMAQVMEKYPETNAVLVRRHGVYVWGEKAKTMTKCYNYLFEIAVKMKNIGLDPAAKPKE
ncbi:17715_t:CDS:2 [Dentiscutata erythropus]|uniref:17715_t:CDS:1 n=1 Tax=Dentiscutata erythropus TaxID=1348616 RepID=A0A9N8W3E2_9GLOM|nr:17715_t:CDS:2 [Dentiscutata erythropus]